MKLNNNEEIAGTDGKTIEDIKGLNENNLVDEIQNKLENYRPKKVRRKWNEKENGK